MDTGRRIRWGVGVGDSSVGESGLSMVIPVVLGDNGDAMMGAGIVCRFNMGGVVCCCCSWKRSILVGDREAREKRSVELDLDTISGDA